MVELGKETKNIKKGDKVCALVSGGGYSEYCIAPYTQCLPIPKSLSFEEASAVPETFFTVWFNLFIRSKIKKNQKILIHGGSRGIGTTAIQFAKIFGLAEICFSLKYFILFLSELTSLVPFSHAPILFEISLTLLRIPSIL